MYNVVHLIIRLVWFDFDFDFSRFCLIQLGLVRNWQNGNVRRQNGGTSKMKVNLTLLSDQTHLPVLFCAAGRRRTRGGAVEGGGRASTVLSHRRPHGGCQCGAREAEPRLQTL